MRITLTKAELDCLSNGDFLADEFLDMISAAEPAGDKFVLSLDEDDADEIRDACGEHLQVVGFDAAYNPTATGQILESLIDKLFVE